MIEYVLLVLYVLACIVLILFVLLQPGKADAAAIFGGGGASSTAFGPRGTKTVLAKVTVGAAVAFFVIAFLFSIPGLFEKKTLGQGVKQAPAAPAPVTPGAPAPAASATPSPAGTASPAAETGKKPETAPATTSGTPGAASNAGTSSKAGASKNAKK